MSKRAFRVGDKVVYPHHGAAVIEGMQKRVIEGETREYWVLRLSYGDLTLMVPTDGADEVGLRGVVPKNELEQVYKVLQSKKQAPAPSNWSRRFKSHVEKLRSGDIYQVAEVVRNLSNRDKDKGLSAGEKRMLTKARQILVSELTFAAGVKEEKAEAMLDEILGTEPANN
jgi:CarD family transcriptional regulator